MKMLLIALFAFSALVHAGPTPSVPNVPALFNLTGGSDLNLFNRPAAPEDLPPSHLLQARDVSLPECAQTCWQNNYALVADCNGDAKCICQSSSFISQVTCCVASSCSAQDQVATYKFAKNGQCGRVGVHSFQSALVKQLRNVVKKIFGHVSSCPDLSPQVDQAGYN